MRDTSACTGSCSARCRRTTCEFARDRPSPDVRARRGRLPRGRPGRLAPPRSQRPLRSARADAARRRSAVLALLRAGRCVRRVSLVSGGEAVRSATVEALEQGETHAVYRGEFDRLRREHPGVGDVLVAVLADQLRRTNVLVLDAYYATAEKRVLRRLRDVRRCYADGVVRLTQDDLASLAGTSRATVNKVLREEERRGTIELTAAAAPCSTLRHWPAARARPPRRNENRPALGSPEVGAPIIPSWGSKPTLRGADCRSWGLLAAALAAGWRVCVRRRWPPPARPAAASRAPAGRLTTGTNRTR